MHVPVVIGPQEEEKIERWHHVPEIGSILSKWYRLVVVVILPKHVVLLPISTRQHNGLTGKPPNIHDDYCSIKDILGPYCTGESIYRLLPMRFRDNWCNLVLTEDDGSE